MVRASFCSYIKVEIQNYLLITKIGLQHRVERSDILNSCSPYSASLPSPSIRALIYTLFDDCFSLVVYTQFLSLSIINHISMAIVPFKQSNFSLLNLFQQNELNVCRFCLKASRKNLKMTAEHSPEIDGLRKNTSAAQMCLVKIDVWFCKQIVQNILFRACFDCKKQSFYQQYNKKLKITRSE